MARQATYIKHYGCHGTVYIGQDAFEGIYWPCKTSTEITNGAQNPQEQVTERCYVSNLNRALKDEARGRFQTGQTNDTMYTNLWQQVLPMMDRQASNAFWHLPSVSNPATCQLLKVRYGQIWTMRKACNYRMPYCPGGRVPSNCKCPLCGQSDSTGHLLGECRDKDMKSIYIERHNEAARLILAEIMKGGFGNRIVCADVGSNSKTEHLAIANSRIPENIMSNRTLQQHGIQIRDRGKIRPDALIVESNSAVPATGKRTASRQLKPSRVINNPSKDPPTRPCRAFVIEVGYASETRYADKVQEKNQQHARLKDLLEAEGFEGVIQPIILGTSGGIFLSQGLALNELGVSKARQEKLCRKLHIHSIQTMHCLIQLRRQKEAKLQMVHKARRKKPPDK